MYTLIATNIGAFLRVTADVRMFKTTCTRLERTIAIVSMKCRPSDSDI
ncbi:hypothetical protein Vi05172_g3977 [Venturia inaequalis]|nr:hypothetical protein Vi05172_g3977 [Venturia inaequalis]